MIAGYEVGARIGEFLGRSHCKVFHTTWAAGTPAAGPGVAWLPFIESAEGRAPVDAPVLARARQLHGS